MTVTVDDDERLHLPFFGLDRERELLVGSDTLAGLLQLAARPARVARAA